MINELLKTVNQTVGGYPVKDLRFLPLDNIIVGLVLDPVYGKPTLRDGFIAVQWDKRGRPIKLNKGRSELNITIYE